MFFEIDKNTFIFIENIAAAKLKEEDNKFFWLFYTNHPDPIKSMAFETKEEAIIWFRNLKYTFHRTKNENI